MRRRVRAALATVRLGVLRTWRRLRTVESRRTALAVAGVALAVALLVTVTGVAVGLASAGTVEAEGVDYWVVPESGGAESLALPAEGPQLGDVHETTAALREDDRVEYASPVAVQPLRIEDPETGAGQYVLAVGVVPPETERSVAGVDVGPLSSGEAVATPAVAEELGVAPGDRIVAGGTGSDDGALTVAAVDDANLRAGAGEVPGVVLPLSDLQRRAGLAAGDRADQLVVATSDPSVREDLEGLYPETRVVERDALVGRPPEGGDLSAALALAASIVAGGVATLFVATTAGLELAARRRELAVLDAVGVSAGTRALLAASETVALSLAGGVLGVALGWLGTGLLDRGVAWYLGRAGVAEVTPLVAAYGLAVALAVGLLAAPYPVVRAARTDALEAMGR